jgi:uncharacterized membrane protein YphA (DoxX/SURF4 family)
MKINLSPNKVMTNLIAAVWLINGLFCKLLNLVPRHREIVSQILGQEFSGIMTEAIGLGEIGIALWVLSGFKSRLAAIVQILLVLTMNIIEYVMVPDLLLFGRINIVFALLFSIVIFLHEYYQPKNR